MALRQKGLLFRAEAASTLAVAPRTGEGFLVRQIFASNPSGTLQHITVINDTARVGFFRVVGLGGRHLPAPNDANRGFNMLDAMVRWFGFKGYPVVQGETLTLNVDTGTCDIFVLADTYDAADIKSTDQCGSKSPDVLFMNYGTNLSAITATGYNKLDSRRNPAEMVAFPFGAPAAGLVPAQRKAHIYMVGGQASGRFVSGGNTATTQYIRPRVGQNPAQTILDRSDVGYPFLGTTPGSGTDYTSSRQALVSSVDNAGFLYTYRESSPFPELDFNANDEFALQVQTAVVGTGQLNASDIDVWTVQRIYPA